MAEKIEFGVVEFVEKNDLARQIIDNLVNKKLWKDLVDFSDVARSDLSYAEKERMLEERFNKFFDDLLDNSKVVMSIKEKSVTIKLK